MASPKRAGAALRIRQGSFVAILALLPSESCVQLRHCRLALMSAHRENSGSKPGASGPPLLGPLRSMASTFVVKLSSRKGSAAEEPPTKQRRSAKPWHLRCSSPQGFASVPQSVMEGLGARLLPEGLSCVFSTAALPVRRLSTHFGVLIPLLKRCHDGESTRSICDFAEQHVLEPCPISDRAVTRECGHTCK